MDIHNMKNMVVLKNLPSNMIEEAFVVLKNNVKIHKIETVDKIKGKQKIETKGTKLNNNEYVIKEAELIISEYMDKINKKEFENICNNKKLEMKCKKLKAISCFLGAFSVLASICILFG